MKETPCPNCGKPLTGDMVRSSNVPCQFRCGDCRERLYEYKVSAPIMLVSLAGDCAAYLSFDAPPQCGRLSAASCTARADGCICACVRVSRFYCK